MQSVATLDQIEGRAELESLCVQSPCEGEGVQDQGQRDISDHMPPVTLNLFGERKSGSTTGSVLQDLSVF